MPGLLDRRMYDYRLAAHLLGMPPSTLHWWLEGRAHHAPVLRESPTGDGTLTWGEFVEARYVEAYRRQRGVSLQRIRAFIQSMRERTGEVHPLATEKPWVGPGQRLMIEAQLDAGAKASETAIIEGATGQLMLSFPAQSFLDVVEFETIDDARIVTRIHPAGKASPVVIDPGLRGGLASVRGISTIAIRELVDAGDPIEAVADDFGLTLDQTIAALHYERTLAPAA